MLLAKAELIIMQKAAFGKDSSQITLGVSY